eukprot:CAMPEP_0113829374 /NCGR_PEP_ID=MMETSP0328-20130328/5764_1 /TAXON_ID=39455 /ORGANISM="Alexandrium minutum" /LENGTH=170 /DNA_ID=CAMNT_0000797421 /DNA_START=598 /DNA_END=1108 /DNA_ORIENTATION=- /assembly_acc=CAM_ASM_000350
MKLAHQPTLMDVQLLQAARHSGPQKGSPQLLQDNRAEPPSGTSWKQCKHAKVPPSGAASTAASSKASAPCTRGRSVARTRPLSPVRRTSGQPRVAWSSQVCRNLHFHWDLRRRSEVQWITSERWHFKWTPLPDPALRAHSPAGMTEDGHSPVIAAEDVKRCAWTQVARNQ